MSEALRERVVIALGDAYEIGREIGRGGMGVVYGATDRRLRRGVAVKVLPPELAYRDDVRQRFLREAQTAAQLSHPNIVPIYAVEERDGLVCFAMALVEGESLAARIAREGQLPIPEISRILIAVADALGYAHAHGTVHRDVKPDNILLDRDGRVMVTDFGIARAAEGDARLTVTGIAVGTPAYMSPEQAIGDKEIDGRADLYSLGVVAYQMLTGVLPFQASNTPGMLMKHIGEVPPPIADRRPDAPRGLIRVVERALAKKPADRLATAQEFRDAVAFATTANSAEIAPRVSPPADTALRASGSWKHAALREPPRQDPRPDRAALDAVSAANAGFPRSNLLARLNQDPEPESGRRQRRGLEPMPSFMPASWQQARQGWGAPSRRSERESVAQFTEMSVEERIVRLRRRTASQAVTVAMLAAINLTFSPQFWWFLFPAGFMAVGWLQRAASLWADGVRMGDIFGRQASERLAQAKGTERPALRRGEVMERLAPPEVLAGPHGAVVRRAAQDQQTIRESVGKLSKADSDLIPDVLPTVDALAERVGSLALALHRLDEDVRPGTLEELDTRIAASKALPESPERDRKVELLERQRSTLADLAARRDTLVEQLDSASLMLQNMRLDLIALRSAGVQSVLNDVGSATQEARALSRDIANALDAAKQVR